jgi:arylsulfatase A-like enzyme
MSFSKRRADYLNFRGLSGLVDRRLSKHLKALYVESLQTTDELIHDTIAALRLSNRLNDTMIIVSADHGEEFMEDGFFGHSIASSSDRLLHVPLMFYCPWLLEPRSIAAPVSLIDILPTVCDLLGYNLPGSARGISLKQLMSSSSEEPAVAETFWERPIFSEAWQTDGFLDRKPGTGSREEIFTVRKHNYKLTAKMTRKHRAGSTVTQDLRLSDWQTGTALDAPSNSQIISELLDALHEHLETEGAFARSLRRRLELQRLSHSMPAIRKAART